MDAEDILKELKVFLTLIIPCMGSFFLKGLKMGLQVEVSLAMNWLMYCNHPKNPFMSNMALIFD